MIDDPVTVPNDTESNPDDKKFLSDEFKVELPDDLLFTVFGVVATSLASSLP